MELTGEPLPGRSPARGTSALSDGLGVARIGTVDQVGKEKWPHHVCCPGDNCPIRQCIRNKKPKPPTSTDLHANEHIGSGERPLTFAQGAPILHEQEYSDRDYEDSGCSHFTPMPPEGLAWGKRAHVPRNHYTDQDKQQDKQRAALRNSNATGLRRLDVRRYHAQRLTEWS